MTILTLGANETKQASIAGAQFYLLSAAYPVSVKMVGGGDGSTTELKAGMGFREPSGGRWSGLEITNLSANIQDIEFEVSDINVYDNRVTFGSGSYVPVHEIGTGVVDTINVSKTVVSFSSVHIAANINRKKIMLSFDGGDWWIGSSATYPDDYYRKLSAGDDFELEGCTSDLWLYTNDAGNLYTFEVVANS